MHDCWDGKLQWFMFEKIEENESLVPENFEELLTQNKSKDAAVKGRVYHRIDIPGPSDMGISEGDDSKDESPIWDGQPVDWNELATPSLENSAWREKVKITVQGKSYYYHKISTDL